MMSPEAFGQLSEQVPADVVEARRRRVALRDPAIMFYTSGTTAIPKGWVLSHKAQVRTGVATRIRLGYADGERVFAPCSMFHTASNQPMTATMHAFGTFVSMGHFDPATALELIEAERVTAMFPAFPPLTLGMLNSPGYSPASFARVRTVFTVAPPEALRAMQRRMPHSVLVNAYGMTEFGGRRRRAAGHPGPAVPRPGDRHQGRGEPPAARRRARRDRHPRAEHVRRLLQQSIQDRDGAGRGHRRGRLVPQR
jgi:acyl-CoA synthetase (AMP-forming)/AMP-acid ligase II